MLKLAIKRDLSSDDLSSTENTLPARHSTMREKIKCLPNASDIQPRHRGAGFDKEQ
jgi:hypothetical protein